MGNSIYLDCSTGISGDMLVAALLDLGADRNVMEQALSSIDADGFQIQISRVMKSGIDACDFEVKLDHDHDNHDHDMEYLFGTGRGHTGDEYEQPHGHVHSHEDFHEHSHDHVHEHRHLAEIFDIIDRCEMTEGARVLAKKTFRILAEAEAEAHHSTPEKVGFHEAGAIDSIVDIIAAAVCMDDLSPEKVYVPLLCEGRGTIRCQHGILPVPVPAVVNIVREHQIPLRIEDYRGEYVTPTGAAFAAAVRTDSMLPAGFRILKTGIGAGKRAYVVPGMLRAMSIEPVSQEQDEEKRIVRLESNIDDSTGEEFGYVMEKLLKAGARDVHYYPVFMKKNRPAYQLNVICGLSDVQKMEDIIFSETSTIGVRRVIMDRSILDRELRTVETSLGIAEVKVVDTGSGIRCYPEYRSAAAIAEEKGLPLRDVMRIIEREAEQLPGKHRTID